MRCLAREGGDACFEMRLPDPDWVETVVIAEQAISDRIGRRINDFEFRTPARDRRMTARVESHRCIT